MPKEELVEGIKQAIAQGESMERAMTTFFNAGYSKQEIEEAAVASQQSGFFQGPQQHPVLPQPMTRSQAQPLQPTTAQPVQQHVSGYGQGNPPSKKGVVITIILVVLLLLLLGILTTVILFKEELTRLFASLTLRALF